MSHFTITARHKATGELHEIWCMDNHFGRREYGYIPNVEGGKALTEKEFKAQYKKERPTC